jgi:hypothetical protein|tara:strand:+ start:4225 stop:4668 length:444 start_codon:yes stop_codon:yes gene_type:complete
MKNLGTKLVIPALASALTIGGANVANSGERSLKYAAIETLGAPVSFVIGGAKDIGNNGFEGVYDLTGRAVSEVGRIVNGATHVITGNRYDAEFGEGIHPWADNHAVKLGGWGAVIGGVFFSLVNGALVEATAAGTATGLVGDYTFSK